MCCGGIADAMGCCHVPAPCSFELEVCKHIQRKTEETVLNVVTHTDVAYCPLIIPLPLLHSFQRNHRDIKEEKVLEACHRSL